MTERSLEELEVVVACCRARVRGADGIRSVAYLAVALRTAINVFNPKLVLLGGFLGSLHAVAPAYLDQRLGDQLHHATREGVTISRTQLASDLLLIGAAELAFESLLANPASSGSAFLADSPRTTGRS